MKQMTILGKTIPQLKIERKEQSDKEKYTIDYCLNQIKNEEYLWDMRTWERYKDVKEVREWVLDENRSSKNCGHTAFCVDMLIRVHKVDPETVINAIMENNKIKYKNRLVKCLDNPNLCPRFRKAGNYGDCDCESCE